MGTRLAPEWAPQQAMLLVWPRTAADWGDALAGARAVLAAMIAALAPQPVILVAPDDEAQASIDGYPGLKQSNPGLRVLACPADDIWARDFGPLTVAAAGQRRLLDFRFDGWGGKHNPENDDRVSALLHAQQAFGAGVLQREDLVLEGGSIETNGAGALLTTRRCLLEHNRNPQLGASDYEELFADRFGIHTTHWLTHGELIGDDTDGHIDTLARFVDADTIVYQGCDDPGDPHYPDLQRMAAELAALRRPNGGRYTLHGLALPRPVYDPGDGHRLPAGYANFLIANSSVLVPAFDDPADAAACALLQRCLPGRAVFPIDCRALIRQNGAIHCAAMPIFR